MLPVPARFLFRFAHPCLRLDALPIEAGDDLLDLPERCRVDDLTAAEGRAPFADVRLAWNERGLAIQVAVRRKEKPLVSDASRPRQSDGLTLWLDTRDARTSHRASRFCHQFHFLPTGGGPDGSDPVFVQTKINRASQDAPIAEGDAALLRLHRRGGYRLEAFLPAESLTGFDPEQHPRLGFFYVVRDSEHGEQLLGAGPEFPFAEDPTLWEVLELVGPAGQDEG
jgi:hypothetical protein